MTEDVLIIGGGLIGLASAWRLAERGAKVTVYDPAPGGGASHVAAGMIAPVTEVAYGEEHRLACMVAAARRWPDFAHDLHAAVGADVGYRAAGTLLVGFDRDDAAALDDLHAYQVELGLQVQRLRGRQARAREPLLSPRVRTGLFTVEDHRADPRAVVAALRRACTEAGATIEYRRVAALEQRRGRISGVRGQDGHRRPAGEVVLAAGAWSATIDGLPEQARPPVRPVKGQLLHLRDPSGSALLSTTVRGLVRSRALYLVPQPDGRVVVGASQEERGFDTTVTAGAVRELLDDASTLIPGLDELELLEAIAGLRPTTPDNAPVLGRCDIDGLTLATGHYRNGVLLTPLTAETVSALVAGARPDPVVDVFAPSRFAAAATSPTPAAGAHRPQRQGGR